MPSQLIGSSHCCDPAERAILAMGAKKDTTAAKGSPSADRNEAKAAEVQRAPSGDGMDPKSVSKMLGSMKYSAAHCKDANKKEDAQKALSIYKSLTTSNAKAKLLEDFLGNGGGKGPNAFKFTMTYERTCHSKDITDVSQVENYLTRPKILAINGMTLQDFDSKGEALKAADDLVKMNAEEFGHQEHSIPHENDLLVRFYYVEGQGKRRSLQQHDSRKLMKTTDGRAKGQALVDAVGSEDADGLGLLTSSSSGPAEAGASQVKVENPEEDTVKTQALALRTPLIK